jgi:hypothetical protein
MRRLVVPTKAVLALALVVAAAVVHLHDRRRLRSAPPVVSAPVFAAPVTVGEPDASLPWQVDAVQRYRSVVAAARLTRAQERELCAALHDARLKFEAADDAAAARARVNSPVGPDKELVAELASIREELAARAEQLLSPAQLAIYKRELPETQEHYMNLPFRE